ncbi:MAG: hypothetical protein QM760_19380 [Nibricoccus sp.]
MHLPSAGLPSPRPLVVTRRLVALALATISAASSVSSVAENPPRTAEAGLLFYLSGDRGTTADFAANSRAEPNFVKDVNIIADGVKGAALRCEHTQRLSWWAPGNIYAQRGTLSFFWRAREPVGPTEFPIFRVGYGDHSSWDMVWLRIDYNGHGFDAFVTDINLSRTRVSVKIDPFFRPDEWIHLALSWDETSGIRFYVNGKLAAEKTLDASTRYDAQLDQFGPHSRIISPYQVQSDYNFVRGGDHRRDPHLRPRARPTPTVVDARQDRSASCALHYPRAARRQNHARRVEFSLRLESPSSRRRSRQERTWRFARSRFTTPTT